MPQQVEPRYGLACSHSVIRQIELPGNVVRHEGLRSIESATYRIQHQKEVGQGLSHSFVVIHDRD